MKYYQDVVSTHHCPLCMCVDMCVDMRRYFVDMCNILTRNFLIKWKGFILWNLWNPEWKLSRARPKLDPVTKTDDVRICWREGCRKSDSNCIIGIYQAHFINPLFVPGIEADTRHSRKWHWHCSCQRIFAKVHSARRRLLLRSVFRIPC